MERLDGNTMRILLVEDNRRLNAVVAETLKSLGFAVDPVTCAADAEAAVAAMSYDVMVLDLGLPDVDGMTLLAALRSRGLATPVLVLTARDGARAIVDGLNSGADDYMCKPFVMEELIARLRALLRRPGQPLRVLLCEQNIELDVVERRVRVAGTEIELSRREFSALELFMRRAARVVSKAEFEDAIYGFGEEVASNAVEVLVHRLRKKLAMANATVDIHTLRGLGYMLSGASS
jgi:DNA-binding response OmpR family regulator